MWEGNEIWKNIPPFSKIKQGQKKVGHFFNYTVGPKLTSLTINDLPYSSEYLNFIDKCIFECIFWMYFRMYFRMYFLNIFSNVTCESAKIKVTWPYHCGFMIDFFVNTYFILQSYHAQIFKMRYTLRLGMRNLQYLPKN